ncbi:mCG1037007, partial [Mus musculus]
WEKVHHRLQQKPSLLGLFSVALQRPSRLRSCCLPSFTTVNLTASVWALQVEGRTELSRNRPRDLGHVACCLLPGFFICKTGKTVPQGKAYIHIKLHGKNCSNIIHNSPPGDSRISIK